MNSISVTLSIVFFLYLRAVMSANVSHSSSITPEYACNYAVDTAFCKLFLSSQGSQSLYSFGRFSISKSLSESKKQLDSVNKHLDKSSSALSKSAVMALQDCKQLLGRNVEFLSSVSSTLSSVNAILDFSEADDLKTMLDAILTDQETCKEGLDMMAPADIKNEFDVSLSNGKKVGSVSLAFFKYAWTNAGSNSSSPRNNSNSNKGRKLMLFHHARIGRNGELPLKMSKANRQVFEKITGGRKLLQSPSVLVSKMVVVSKDGSGNFTTIAAAINKAPNNTNSANGYYLIRVRAGVYKEYASIESNKKYIMIVGDGINQTIITGTHNVADGWTTFNSASFSVVGQGFVAIDVTFQNTAGAVKNQAVAVKNAADLSTFYKCSFEGYQDTLLTHAMRQFYKECNIYGTVDFIFGNAAVVFQNCNIYARLPIYGQSNVVTAQGRSDPNQSTGTSVQNCNIAPAQNLGTTKTYLGRPWQVYSRTVVMESSLGSLIDPKGWMPMNGDVGLSTLYYAEYSNTGLGSDTGNRVTWPGYRRSISSVDANNFTVGSFISGNNWLPQTGVPYFSGL